MKQVYYNGRVYLGEGGFASAFSVESGRFVQTGNDKELLAEIDPSDELIDLKGSFVCAGFNDSHMHLLNFGQVLSCAPLYEHTGSLADMLDCLRSFCLSQPPKDDSWLLGRGWNQDLFRDVDRMPNKSDLDLISTSVPIMITRACGHCCVLNSKALELAGISSATKQPEGGAIGFSGNEPDGRLFDNAMELAFRAMPTPSKEAIKNMIRLACCELNRYGITSSQTDDYCVFREVDPDVINSAYRELEAAGELKVRVYEQCNFTELDGLKEFIEAGNITGSGNEYFKIGPLKLLGDGALGSRTAHLSKPYNGTNEYGFSLFAPEHMKELVSYANSKGMQVAVHAIGDACLDEVLDAIEAALTENYKPDHRHGIVHCQISRKDQLERISRLKLHVYAQSIFLDYDNHIVEKLVDPETVKSSYNWKTLMKKGVSVSNGSDCPVELPDVLRGIETAVTRTSLDGTGPYLPQEAFTICEAVDSFTVRSAEASFEENIKGKIFPGQLADFVVLSDDPFNIEPQKIHEIKVIETYLDGKCVFRRRQS